MLIHPEKETDSRLFPFARLLSSVNGVLNLFCQIIKFD